MRTAKRLANLILNVSGFALFSQAAFGGEFAFRIDNLDGDNQGWQNLWDSPANWTLTGGDDDGGNGYPDGTDTFVIDRTANSSNPTRLVTEGGSLLSVAGITGTGTGNQDIVLKHRDFTLGDLEVLASPSPFHIRSERDRSYSITGVISGVGDLLLSRDGGFSNGVDETELITITGASPNTITGSIRLWNSNNSGDNPQPCYWVADKVGAFGQAPTLTLEGRAGANGGIASLQITANAVGGEGAIDDNSTMVFIGAKGVLNMDAGVDEKIGEGNLFIDLAGTGTYAEVSPGVYNSDEDWIVGDGTVTVGAALPLAITDIQYAPDAEPNPQVTLTWTNSGASSYAAHYSVGLNSWDADLDDGILPESDENPADTETITVTFDLLEGLAGQEVLLFRIEER